MTSATRAILAAGVLILFAGAAPAADTRSVTDSAGRRAEVPARVERVYAAGGPASIFLYTLAPTRMLGWNDFGNQVRGLGEIDHLARRGIAVMLSTHDPDHAFLCAHRVALLHQGRLARLGPPDEVITRESLREVYGVEMTVMEVGRADERVARVCVPALGATGRGARPGEPGHRS